MWKIRMAAAVEIITLQPRPLHLFTHVPLPPPFHTNARSHLFRDPHAVAHEAPGLPLAAVQLLSTKFARRTSTLALDPPLTSRDGSTTKLLLRLAKDGAEVEAVIMRYDTSVVRKSPGGEGGGEGEGEGEDDEEDEENETAARSQSGARHAPTAAAARKRESGGRRATLCVSSQVGCAMGCTFCATGTMGKLRSLSAAEILEQADFALAVLGPPRTSRPAASEGGGPGDASDGGWRLRNVVMMGMGEPLDAYPAVVKAVRALTSPARFGLRRAAVTVSTVGVVPRIRSLARDLPGVSLALSLHAPTQELRQRIVPSARAWPLDRLLAAVEHYQRESGPRVFVEYVLLSGVNDAVEHGLLLGELLAGRDVVVNLIPWNPVEAVLEKRKEEGEGSKSRDASLVPPETFAAPGVAAVDAFVEAVRSSSAASSKGNGRPLPVTVRAEKGQGIAGACGQLVVAKKKLERREEEEGGGGGGGGKGVGRGCSSSSPPAAGAFCSSDVPPSTPARDIEELAGGAGGGAGARSRGAERAEAAAAPSRSSSSSGISGVAGTFASWLGFR